MRKWISGVKRTVLVAVLKSRRDQEILLRERWYRIPVSFLPKRAFTHIAFYQPAVFGRYGKRIEYYARIIKRETRKRIELLPDEPHHLRAHDDYIKFTLARIQKLKRPIRNIIPRRIVFGFTDLKTLRAAHDILELYGVPKTEQIIEKALARLGINLVPEYTVSHGGKRVRIDLAVFCRNGALAIECDNEKAHGSRKQKTKDDAKDAFLRTLGWTVLRFREREIIERLPDCTERVVRAIRSLGGREDGKNTPERHSR